MDKKYDLVIIGSGMGSFIAQGVRAAQPDITILVIDKRKHVLGGTCPFEGCHPKKLAQVVFKTKEAVEALSGKGLQGKLEIDMDIIRQRIHDYRKDFPENTLATFEQNNIDYIEGTASFTNEKTVTVNDQIIHAGRFVIASGSDARALKIPGGHHVKTSSDFFNLDRLPSKALFIGSGYIALELASMMSQAGTDVKLVEFTNTVLPMFDQQMVAFLTDALKERNIQVEFNREVKSIEELSQGSYRVRMERTDEPGTIDELDTGMVFNTTGRPPNTGELNLKAAGIKYDGSGILVNEYMQTSNPWVYAAGDIVTRQPDGSPAPALTPVGGRELEVVAANLNAGTNLVKMHYGAVPSVVFSIPQLASVGLKEQDLFNRDQFDIIMKPLDFLVESKAKGVKDQAVKFIIERKTGLLKGAQIIGHGIEDMINMYAIAINNQMRASDLWNSSIHAYPTLSYYTNQLLKNH
ncbi:MAG: NAD(P)/FAD-dependent oxidoreductase [Desulfobacterales bacterium]|nr:NAD(P)/FAD-dependent oxidoreductase [Desulfobacterales bacterium]